VLRSFSSVALVNLARQLAFLVVNAVLFDRLSRSVFGAIALGFSYMTVFGGLGDFGIRQVAWREIARRPARARALTGPFLLAKTTTAALAAGLYLLLMPWLWNVDAGASIYFAFALGIVLHGSFFDFPFYGLGRIDLAARYTVVASAVYLAGCLLLVTDDDRAWWVPAIFAASMALLLLLEVRWFRAAQGSVPLRMRPARFRWILRTSWPLGVGETFHRLALSYPVILIGALAGSEAAGNYRIAELAYSFLAQFGHMAGSAAFSRIAHRYRHDRSTLSSTARSSLGFVAAPAILAGAVLALLGPLLLTMVFDDVAPETLAVTRVLGVALVFAGPARFLRTLLASVDAQRALLVVNIASLVVGIAAGSIALAAYGILGMGAAVALVEFMSLAFLVWVYLRRLNVAPAGASQVRADS
jgi:O-antigen/teichoic acid export membrane protein